MMRTLRHAAVIVMCWTSVVHAQGYSISGANAYVQRHDYNGLVQYAGGWTQSQPRDPNAWYYLGTAYFIGLHQPASSVGPLQKAVALKPDWTVAWNGLGFAYMDLKRYDEAADAFGRCVHLMPGKASFWNNLASAYSWANKPAMAARALQDEERAIAASGTDVDWYNLGNGYANLGHRDNAKNAYRRALQLNPRNALAWNNLGVAEQQTGNVSGALAAYEKSAALGDPLARNNIAGIQAASAPRAASGGGNTGYSPQRMLEAVRQGQAHAWEINDPGQLNNPHGRPL